jgi:hypothetical protein
MLSALRVAIARIRALFSRHAAIVSSRTRPRFWGTAVRDLLLAFRRSPYVHIAA